MTFDEIVAQVADDLNLTATTAITRIGDHVNKRYRQIARKLGMNVYSRVELDFICQAGSREQEVLDTNNPAIQKITNIWFQKEPNTRYVRLEPLTYDEMLETIPGNSDPVSWAPKRSASQDIVFLLDSTVDAGCTLVIEGEEVKSNLAGDDVPDFLESFHEILILGAKIDELMKMEKPTLARTLKDEYTEMLNELAYKTILQANQSILQGKNSTRPQRGNLSSI